LRPYLEKTHHKKGLAQALECLPSKHEALSSNSNATKKKKKKKEKEPNRMVWKILFDR
jgi:hypothetical protein